MLQRPSPKVRIGLGVVLSTLDAVLSLVLIFGGLLLAEDRRTNEAYATGCAMAGAGIFLIYLSIGLWTKSRWRAATRVVLYAGTFLFSAVGAALIRDNVMYLVVAALCFAVFGSAAYLRLMMEEDNS
jgi:hypothetical protein